MPKPIASTMVRVLHGNAVCQYPQILREQLLGLPEGQWLSVQYFKPAKGHTDPQRAYYYAVIIPLVWQDFLSKGITETVGHGTAFEYEQDITQEKTHEILTRQLSDGMSLSRMNREELSDYLDRCIQFAAKTLGVTIPPPTKKESKDGKQ